MIDLHFWPTPNGKKITIFLEEVGLPYRIVPLNIGAGDQKKPEYLAINPNGKMPAIVDFDPADGEGPLAVFESAAILTYLADKTRRFLPPPSDVRARLEALEWLAWQIAHVGPMMGQLGHFALYAEHEDEYGIERFEKETLRLFGVLDGRLEDREFVAQSYSIADMALFPWISAYGRYGIDLDPFPNVHDWIDRIASRPAVQRGLEVGADLGSPPPIHPRRHRAFTSRA